MNGSLKAQSPQLRPSPARRAPLWAATISGALLGCAVASVAALTAFMVPVGVSPAAALERRTEETVVVRADETINDDLFASGKSVRVDGRVRGDVIAFAQNVTVTGVIEGDLISAGAQVVLDGEVQGDVRAAGHTVQLNGAVGRNVLGAAQLLQLGGSGRVNGNVIGASETLSLAGDVGGSVTGAGETVELQGRVGREADLAVESFTFGPRASIGGDLTYHAQEELSVPSGTVAGSVRHVPVQHEKPDMARPQERFNAFGNFLSLTWLTGSAVVGLVLLRLFPRVAAEFLAVLETQPLPSLGLGVLAMIGTIPVAVVAALTVIGLPVALLLGAGYLGGMLVGWLFLALAAGSIMVGLVRKGRPWHPSWAFLLGLVVLYVLTRLPFLGGLVTFVGLAFGLGAFLVALHRTWRGGGEAMAPSGSSPSVISAPAPI
jgi:cytoskeletal protein CcmA (bactofilin family)